MAAQAASQHPWDRVHDVRRHFAVSGHQVLAAEPDLEQVWVPDPTDGNRPAWPHARPTGPSRTISSAHPTHRVRGRIGMSMTISASWPPPGARWAKAPARSRSSISIPATTRTQSVPGTHRARGTKEFCRCLPAQRCHGRNPDLGPADEPRPRHRHDRHPGRTAGERAARYREWEVAERRGLGRRPDDADRAGADRRSRLPLRHQHGRARDRLRGLDRRRCRLDEHGRTAVASLGRCGEQGLRSRDRCGLRGGEQFWRPADEPCRLSGPVRPRHRGLRRDGRQDALFEPASREHGRQCRADEQDGDRRRRLHAQHPLGAARFSDWVDLDGAGTSAATPQVAAAAALWLHKNGGNYPARDWQRAEAARRAILDSAFLRSGASRPDRFLGSGLLRAMDALAITRVDNLDPAAARFRQASPFCIC